MKFTMDQIYNHIWRRLSQRGNVPHGTIVMAETAFPIDLENYMSDAEYEYIGLTKGEKAAITRFQGNQRRVSGQTPDDLRTAALKYAYPVDTQAYHW
jgi:hypothetical protein